MSTWSSNLRLINGLWPDADWSHEESDLYRERLHVLDQTWLQSAIKRLKTEYNGLKPPLSKLLTEYGRVREERSYEQRIAMDRKSQNMTADSIGQSDTELMRDKIRSLTPEQRDYVSERMKSACGIKLDFDVPLEAWSTLRLAMTCAAIK